MFTAYIKHRNTHTYAAVCHICNYNMLHCLSEELLTGEKRF